MRLLCVGNRYPPWSRGGYEVIWAGAVSSLRVAGHEVRVLTTVPDPSDEPAARDAEPDVHRDLRWYWREHRFPRLGLRACLALERANGLVLERHVRALAPDVIIWWSMGGMSLSLLERARRAGHAAIGVVGDDWMVYAPAVDGWTSRWRGRLRAAAPLAERLTGVPALVELDRAARWMFISEHVRDEARRSGLRLPRSVVAHPGVDPVRFAGREPEPWAWRLLYCGRIDPRKGIATAIEALAMLPPHATLRIDGHGDAAHAAELSALATRLGVADRVRFCASDAAEVPAVYAGTDAVVFPVTWREPWGLVPLEGMAVGRPVLAARAGGGAAEYLEEGRNCLQFEPGDAAGLAAAVTRVASDQSLRAQLRDSGRATAARFTEAAFHDALERELHAVSAEGKRGG
jgi:glycosyltransferase involved in cell wall biosynthesis